MYQLLHHGIDLPMYDSQEVTFARNQRLKKEIDANQPDFIVRAVDIEFPGRTNRTSHIPPLMQVLKLADQEFQRVREIAPRHLAVVDFDWGVAEDDQSRSPSDAYSADPDHLVPKGLVLVAKVKVVTPCMPIPPASELNLRTLVDGYYSSVDFGESYLHDLAALQCVSSTDGAVLVDIEPRMSTKD